MAQLESVDETVIEQLVMLGYEREECIKASKLVINYKDINEVQDKVIEIENQQTQQQYNIDDEKQLDPYKVWKCDECSTMNILYKSICKSCKTPCKNIKNQIELNIKNIIKISLPTWSKVNNNNIKLQKVENALSSKLYIISNPENERYIFRIYNPNTMNEYHSEIQYLFSNILEIGPKLISKFTFGQIEEYLNSRQTERIKDLYKNQSVYKTVAEYMAKIHSSKLSNIDGIKSNLTDGWIHQILITQSNKLKDVENHEKFKWLTDIIKEYYAKNSDTKNLNVYEFLDIELKWLYSMNKKHSHDLYYRPLTDLDLDKDEKEKKFANTTETVFCHNDLNHRNILLLNQNININDNEDNKMNENDDEYQVKIIDYEYCGYCSRFWDFGHYFCEIAINASLPPPKYFEINIKNEYPELKYRKKFVQYYLNELLRISLNVNNLKDVAIIDGKYIDLFVNTIEVGALWINLTVTFWAFSEWQNAKGKEVGFDFKRYTMERIHCYFQKKQDIYNMKLQ